MCGSFSAGFAGRPGRRRPAARDSDRAAGRPAAAGRLADQVSAAAGSAGLGSAGFASAVAGRLGRPVRPGRLVHLDFADYPRDSPTVGVSQSQREASLLSSWFRWRIISVFCAVSLTSVAKAEDADACNSATIGTFAVGAVTDGRTFRLR